MIGPEASEVADDGYILAHLFVVGGLFREADGYQSYWFHLFGKVTGCLALFNIEVAYPAGAEAFLSRSQT